MLDNVYSSKTGLLVHPHTKVLYASGSLLIFHVIHFYKSCSQVSMDPHLKLDLDIKMDDIMHKE